MAVKICIEGIARLLTMGMGRGIENGLVKTLLMSMIISHSADHHDEQKPHDQSVIEGVQCPILRALSGG